MMKQLVLKWGFVFAISLSLLGYSGLVQVHWRYGTLRDAHVPETIAWYSIAFIAYVCAISWVEKKQHFAELDLGRRCCISTIDVVDDTANVVG
jgi:hypothetical protein